MEKKPKEKASDGPVDHHPCKGGEVMETRDVIELILGSIACLAVALAGIKISEASHKLDATQYMWEEL